MKGLDDRTEKIFAEKDWEESFWVVTDKYLKIERETRGKVIMTAGRFLGWIFLAAVFGYLAANVIELIRKSGM